MALRFEDMLEQLRDQGRRSVLNTWRLYEDGLIDYDTFIDVASTLLAHIAERGAAYGRLSYHQIIATMTGGEIGATSSNVGVIREMTTPTGVGRALDTIAKGEPERILTRLARLGSIVPIEETQAGYAEELQADPKIEGWIRGLNDTACELCEFWYWDGRIWPKDHPMPTHKGCMCQQIPAWSEVSETQKSRAARRRRQAIENRDRRSAEVRRLQETGEL